MAYATSFKMAGRRVLITGGIIKKADRDAFIAGVAAMVAL